MKNKGGLLMKKRSACFATFALIFSFYSVNTKAAQPGASPPVNLHEQNTMSVLWFQKAGEAKGLYYQGYNIGKMRLDIILSKKPKQKELKPAVVLDIDETVLDNSPNQARYVVTDKGYPVNWNEWIDRAQAKPLPGAIDFLKYADSKGVVIYYISNRKEPQKAATIKNLQNVGAPQADEEHILLLQPGERGKETRRQQVAKTHEIVLLFGDNLGDFSGFDGLSATERIQAVDRQKDEFGRKLILFPNSMYGDWEGAIYNYNSKCSDEEKAKLRKDSLETYQP